MDDSTVAETEDTDALITDWQEQIVRLRDIADQARWLAARLSPHYGGDIAADLRWVVKEFRHIAGDVKQAGLESLILSTTVLHHRDTGVLNPDRGPNPMPSPFVRRMPKEQAEIEAKCREIQCRHVAACEVHILQALEHFVHAWTAPVDSCLICDWAILDDEFPKLTILADEVDRAFTIWLSMN